MTSKSATEREAGDITKRVFTEKVIPQHERRTDGLAIKVVVPFLKEGHNLIALLSHSLIREEEKLSLTVDINEGVLTFLDKRISLNITDKI
jgi:hypothetical protein